MNFAEGNIRTIYIFVGRGGGMWGGRLTLLDLKRLNFLRIQDFNWTIHNPVAECKALWGSTGLAIVF